MSSDSLERKPTVAWWVLGLVFGYLAITLLVAIVARPPAPDEMMGGWHQKFEPLLEKLPGAGAWQWGLGLDTPLATVRVDGFQAPHILGMALAVLMGYCFYTARRNKESNEKDADIERTERLKQRTRERMAPQGRR